MTAPAHWSLGTLLILQAHLGRGMKQVLEVGYASLNILHTLLLIRNTLYSRLNSEKLSRLSGPDSRKRLSLIH